MGNWIWKTVFFYFILKGNNNNWCLVMSTYLWGLEVSDDYRPVQLAFHFRKFNMIEIYLNNNKNEHYSKINETY
jgi:hypothetical protein